MCSLLGLYIRITYTISAVYMYMYMLFFNMLTLAVNYIPTLYVISISCFISLNITY